MIFSKNKIKVRRYGRTSVFRVHQNKFLAEYFEDIAPESVLNLGAQPNTSDKQGKTYEDYFPGADFHTLDMIENQHERHTCADLTALPKDMGSYDAVLAMSVIEHIDRPWTAVENIINLINPGGYLYVAMPWFYPVHEGPSFGDYWRITPSGIKLLFENLILVKTDYFPNAIVSVRDRKNYWNDEKSTYVGSSLLFKRPFK